MNQLILQEDGMMYKPVLCSLLFMSMVCAAANGENFRAMDFQFEAHYFEVDRERRFLPIKTQEKNG